MQRNSTIESSKVGLVTVKHDVVVYFPRTDKNDPDGLRCAEVFPVSRSSVMGPGTPAQKALLELLSGPTDAERTDGYYTVINPLIRTPQLTRLGDDGSIEVDFPHLLLEGVYGTCALGALMNSIEETLKNAEGVTRVVITIDGQPPALDP